MALGQHEYRTATDCENPANQLTKPSPEMLTTRLKPSNPRQALKITILATLLITCTAIKAQYVGIYPLYDSYRGNSDQQECWNTFLIDSIGNTSQAFSDYSKISIEMATLGKSGKILTRQTLSLTNIDDRFLIGMLKNPKCSQNFAVTNVVALDGDDEPMDVQVAIYQKNNLITQGIKIKNLINK